MRVSICRTGAPGRRIDSEEEALLALSGTVEEHIRCLFKASWGFTDRGDEQRSVRDVVKDSTVLGSIILPEERPILGRTRPGGRGFAFDVFTERNVLTWPLSPAELRRDAGSACASGAELAADLNRRLREETAHVVRECAGFGKKKWVIGEFRWEEETWWESGAGGVLGAVSADDVADAVAAGQVRWTAAADWTPEGGVRGDPFTVCRYRWGPVRAEVRLEPAELLAQHIAGSAPLTLYGVFVDYGHGTHEIIWPRQNIVCCGVDSVIDAASPPVAMTNWGQPGAAAAATARQCLVCGSVRYGSWLTCRPAGPEATLPLGVVEALDALPAETLAAGHRLGLHAIAPELPASP